ncbi:hypothetical protein LA080_011361 [Diaporthe eres]|uniref:Uncharacterized protein n=1 Tax=Diaporthe vaccinii TaxID=105482 RepID=A0ABR4DV66_9PEZI|nr:hypothetical protein LA080_011361 [Diaporthe eres]
MVDKKPVEAAKKAAVQTTTITASASIKKPAPTTTTASVLAKNPPIQPAVAARPNSSSGPKTGSSPQDLCYEPPLSLKKHGFRVPVFKPRDPQGPAKKPTS